MARPLSSQAPARSATVYVSAAARPHRQVPGWQPAVLTALVAGAAVTAAAGDIHSPHLSARLICATGTIAFIVSALGAVLRGTAWLRHRLAVRLGDTHATVVRILLVITGVAITAIIALGLLALPVGHLVLGGALTGALLGIAGQQTLANLVAGVVLLLSRTVAVGDRIRLHSGPLGGTFEGTVTEIGLVHLHLRTADVPLWIPNTQVLSAAIAVLDARSARPPAPAGRPIRRAIRRRQRRQRASRVTTSSRAPTFARATGRREAADRARAGGQPHEASVRPASLPGWGYADQRRAGAAVAASGAEEVGHVT